jgi:hypothetical protein
MQHVLDVLKTEHKNVTYEELIDYIFLKNNKKRIILQTPTLRHSKDIFYFCLDIFCKGLLCSFGDENKRLEMDTLNMIQIQYVIDKLSYTGIMSRIQIECPMEKESQLIDAIDSSALSVVTKSLSDLNRMRDDEELKNFYFSLKLKECTYVISFELQMI